MSVKEKIVNSVKELNGVYSLVALAMLLALRIVVGIFANATLPMFGNMLKISINFLPIAVAAIMFGPIGAGLVGGLGDVLSFFIFPTGGAYFPGFTLNGILTGFILGIFLYKNNVSVKSVLISWSINAVFIEVLLSGYWLYFIYSMGREDTFIVYLLTRAVSEAIKFIPSVLIIFAVGKGLTKAIKIRN
ncbi:MAG: folate family ECF transporter S component [Ruminococcus sp.]|nr:folate family ECF transporter S component [Ruminococcus sp.]